MQARGVRRSPLSGGCRWPGLGIHPAVLDAAALHAWNRRGGAADDACRSRRRKRLRGSVCDWRRGRGRAVVELADPRLLVIMVRQRWFVHLSAVTEVDRRRPGIAGDDLTPVPLEYGDIGDDAGGSAPLSRRAGRRDVLAKRCTACTEVEVLQSCRRSDVRPHCVVTCVGRWVRLMTMPDLAGAAGVWVGSAQAGTSGPGGVGGYRWVGRRRGCGYFGAPASRSWWFAEAGHMRHGWPR